MAKSLASTNAALNVLRSDHDHNTASVTNCMADQLTLPCRINSEKLSPLPNQCNACRSKSACVLGCPTTLAFPFLPFLLFLRCLFDIRQTPFRLRCSRLGHEESGY